MRFGLFIPQGWRQDLVGIDPADHWQVMRDLATAADRSPVWESIWVFDHMHAVPEPNGEATHEAWTLMSAFAASTSRVRLGQMCTCMAYRNPAHLAKIATTVDIVSGGRVEMGIGAGWYEHEWRAYGYGFPRAGIRLDMLDEGVQIMQQMWRTGLGTLDGQHYQVDGAQLSPLPLQAGGIPLWVAGGGETKTLRIAAQYADYTNFDGSVDGFTHKQQVLAEHCDRLGRDLTSITRSANYNVVIAPTQAEVDAKLEWIYQHYLTWTPGSAAAQKESWANGLLVGTPETIVERLSTMKELGMTYAICYFLEAAWDRSGIELFEAEVAPALI